MMPLQSIEQFLYRKSALCDAQDWDAYVELFDESAEFHMPQWDSDHAYTTDPKSEMSLIYYPTRAGLEDRVFRLRTGKSAASTPMPRTMHQITNVRAVLLDSGHYRVDVNWATHHVRVGVAGQFFGWATYDMAPAGESWKIFRKHVVLLNDKINAVLDFYHV